MKILRHQVHGEAPASPSSPASWKPLLERPSEDRGAALESDGLAMERLIDVDLY